MELESFYHICDLYNNAIPENELPVFQDNYFCSPPFYIQKALQNFEGKSQNEFWKVAMRPGKPLLFSIIDNTLQAWYNETIVGSFNDGIWKDILKW